MKRMVDLRCPSCAKEMADQFLSDSVTVKCECGSDMEQIWWKRRTQRSTCWDEKEAVVIFERLNPIDEASRFSFPARADKPTPPGMIRHVARSDREVGQLERMTKTLNQDRWYDRNGKGFDT